MSLRLWAVHLPWIARGGALAPLLQKIEPPASTPYAGLEASYIAKRVKRATRRPWLMRDRTCLREGLLAYRFLKLAGFKPALHFGLDRTSVAGDHLSAHCWVVLDGQIVLNPPTPGMVEILVHGARDPGTPQGPPGPLAGTGRSGPA
jgi:hypothetical protein